jgi:hypothetical protein
MSIDEKIPSGGVQPSTTQKKLINQKEAKSFLALFDADPVYTFQIFPDRKDQKGAGRICHGPFDKHVNELLEQNKYRNGIFFTVNMTDGKGRKAENIVKVRAAFVDLDGAPLEPLLDACKLAGLPPTGVVESSPGKYHVYWVLTGCELSQFKPLQKALAARFDGDPVVCDLSRVMRLPGYYHFKKEPFLTHVIHQDRNAGPYYPSQLIEGLGLVLEADAKCSRKNANQATKINTVNLIAPTSLSDDEYQRISSALSCIPSFNYDDWIKVGMSLHYETGGSEQGLGLFIGWSSSTPEKFTIDACREKWEGFTYER